MTGSGWSLRSARAGVGGATPPATSPGCARCSGSPRRIIELELRVEALQSRTAELLEQNRVLRQAIQVRTRVFAAGPTGEAVVLRPGTRPQQESASTALAIWRPLQF